MARVIFRFEEDPEISVCAEAGENVLQVAARAGIAINAPCSGYGTCGKCLVQILQGNMQSSKSFYINDVEYEEGWRLACTSRITEDVIIYVK